MSGKESLRAEIKTRLKNVSPEEFDLQGVNAVPHLRSSYIWSKYKTVFIFLSMNSEIETRPLLESSLNDGKKVFAPKAKAEGLIFYHVLSPLGPWLKGPFGIREPIVEGLGNTKPAGEEDFPAIIVTPGLAFDRAGNRLGRGKGFYDRFFAKLDSECREYFALGLCMDFQLADHVPVLKNDKQMNGILTEKELHLVQDGKE
jgi:5-formyltetrahydrofolate cyclo-ligase